MPVLAGWLTGEQVSEEIIEQTLFTMGEVLAQHGGQRTYTSQPGAGLITFSDPGYAMQQNNEPHVLDWVPDRRTLVYRRPLSGLHPLYYIENWPAQGNLLFASEIKALLALGFPRQIHLAALDALLRYGFIPAPWTIFKDIQVVPAGSLLRWQRAKIFMNPATDYQLDKLTTPQVDTPASILANIETVMAGMLPPHEQLVSLTGGGNASTLATILAAQHTTVQFTVASIGYKNKRGKGWQTVGNVAESCQRPLLEITGVDQPEFWIAALAALEAPCVDTRLLAWHQLLHTVVAETGARVAISGLGANTLLGMPRSHRTELPVINPGEPAEVLQRYWRVISRPLPSQTLQLWSGDAVNILMGAESWDDTLHARKLARRAAQFTDQRQRFYYLDLHLRLPDLYVQPVQQQAIHEQIAVRSPYLHGSIIEALTQLPETLTNDQPKHLLLSTLLQRLRPDHTGTQATLELTAPFTSLLRKQDSELLQQLLSPTAIKATGIFSLPAVTTLLKEHGDKAHVNKTAARELLLVFTTQLLCQLFDMKM